MIGRWRIWFAISLALLALFAFHYLAQIAGPNRSLLGLLRI